MYYVQGFDPALIISQIVSMQALLYRHLGLWLCVLTALGGSEVSSLSLGNFFSSSAMSISFAGGWIAIIACWKGMNIRGGAESVGIATTETVVYISVGILVSDFVLTQLFLTIYG